MSRVISPESWRSRGVVCVARSLPGKVLAQTGPAGLEARVILETEAYVGVRWVAKL